MKVIKKESNKSCTGLYEDNDNICAISFTLLLLCIFFIHLIPQLQDFCLVLFYDFYLFVKFLIHIMNCLPDFHDGDLSFHFQM